MRSNRTATVFVCVLATVAYGQSSNPGRVNVVTTPWSVNWLSHANDAAAMTDLGFDSWWTSSGLIADANNAEFSVTRQTGLVNVKHYGATGDGVTDDTVAIALAVSQLVAGGTLYFPSGTYRMTVSVSITLDDVTVCGNSAKLYLDAASLVGIAITGDDCEVYGLEIYSDGPTFDTSYSGVRCLGDRAWIHHIYCHDLYGSGVELRALQCRAEHIFTERCRKDGVLFKDNTSIDCMVSDSVLCTSGRSAVACDGDVMNMQIVRVYAYNTGNTTYIAEHHNTFHFEDCNEGLIQDCYVRWDADHDFDSNTDAQLKYIICISGAQAPRIDGLTFVVDTDFSGSSITGWKFVSETSGVGGRAIVLRNIRIENNADVTLTLTDLQINDVELYDCDIFGPVSITQVGAGTTVDVMQNVHVDGNDLEFDFYLPGYGNDPNGTVRNCTFEHIDGDVFKGRFLQCEFSNNRFYDCNRPIVLWPKSTAWSSKSTDCLIWNNVFEDCNDVLTVAADTTAAAHRNMFYRNVILGRCDQIFTGSTTGQIIWRDSIIAPTATYNTLEDSNWVLDSSGRSQFDDEDYRSGAATPVGAVTPIYIGEEYLETSTPKWYKATATTNADWVALN